MPTDAQPWLADDPVLTARVEDAMATEAGLSTRGAAARLPVPLLDAADLPLRLRGGGVDRLTDEGRAGQLGLPRVADELYRSARRLRVFVARPVTRNLHGVLDVVTLSVSEIERRLLTLALPALTAPLSGSSMSRLLGVLVAAIFMLAPLSNGHKKAPDERAAVLRVVQRLFDGMRAGDSAMVRSTFHPNAQLATAIVRQGNAIVEIDTMDSFIRAVGTPHDDVWDERLSNTSVQVDGTLASVWTDYSFYLGSKFSHCGVDAFQLAKSGGEWRIVALADTRRRQGCAETGGAGVVEYYPMGGAMKLPFSSAVRVGNMLYLAGQIGADTTGTLVKGGIGPETRQTMENIKGVLERQVRIVAGPGGPVRRDARRHQGLAGDEQGVHYLLRRTSRRGARSARAAWCSTRESRSSAPRRSAR